MSVLTIIPARGGSKGIPRKNVRLVGGKPLLAHSIEQARGTPAVTRVVVSTDDAEIAAVAKQFGAEVVWRPADISGDTASSESALLHVLTHLRDTENYEPELVVFLQATSPLRRPDDIQNAIDTLRRENADSLFSCCPQHGFVWRQQGGKLDSFTYDHRKRPRRQDAPEDLTENGSIYVFKPWVLHQFNNRLGGNVALHRMDPLDSFQVDEPRDLELLDQLLAFRKKQAGLPDLTKVRLLVFDFDGVMTDNRVLVDVEGNEAVFCSRGDGLGLGRLKAGGLEMLVLSLEKVPVAAARCKKLEIECILGCENKLAKLQSLARERNLMPDQIAYMGNDVNDLECMNWVGTSFAPADALPEVKQIATVVTTLAGGQGAVREVCDLFLMQRKEGAKRDKA